MKLNKAILGLLFFLSTILNAQFLELMQEEKQGNIYYVDATLGNDSNDGLTKSHPIKTISKVESLTLLPNDKVYFKRGETWREQLDPNESGTQGKPITFGAYGSGDKPIINGANVYNTFGYGTVNTTTITKSPAQSTDDGFTYLQATYFGLDNTYSQIGLNSTTNLVGAFIRFPNVTVPQGATITSAKITFTANQTNNNNTVNCIVTCEDTSNSVTFTNRANYDARHKTSATVNWNTVEGWTLNSTYDSPEIKTIVQEVISRGDWSSGNALSVFLTNNSSTTNRLFWSYDNGSKYAVLSVTYSQTVTNDNKWRIVSPITNDNMVLVRVDGKVWDRVSTKAELTTDKYYVQTATSPDSIYLYSTTNPNSRTVEIGTRSEGLRFTAIKYNTVKDIQFEMCTYAGLRGLNAQANSNIKVQGCEFYHNGQAGVQFYNRYNNATIQNCVSDSNGNGYYADEADSIYFLNNSATNNIPRTFSYTDGHGIGVYDGTNCLVEGNTVIGNCGGIVFDPHSGAHNIIIRYNVSKANKQADGENLSIGNGSGTSNIYYNALINDRCAIFNSGIGTTYFYNNTIIDTNNTTGGTTFTVMDATNLTSKNNLIYSTKASGQMAYIVAGTLNGDYNLYYAPSGANLIKNGSTNYTSLATYAAAVNKESHSLQSNPLLNSNYSLQVNSPAINTGTNVSLTRDILGNTINGTVDIGAYEK